MRYEVVIPSVTIHVTRPDPDANDIRILRDALHILGKFEEAGELYWPDNAAVFAGTKARCMAALDRLGAL